MPVTDNHQPPAVSRVFTGTAGDGPIAAAHAELPTAAHQAASTDDAWVFPHGVTGISAHALFRYRGRLDRRCSDPIPAVIQDLERGVTRVTPPRWAHMDSRPVDFFIAVGAD